MNVPGTVAEVVLLAVGAGVAVVGCVQFKAEIIGLGTGLLITTAAMGRDGDKGSE